MQRKRTLRNSKCDLCDNAGHEWHHIYSRNMTMNLPEARSISNQPELGAWLCHTCHQYKADLPEYQDKIFQKLYMLWSYEAVRFYHRLFCKVWGKEPFNIPEPDRRENDMPKAKEVWYAFIGYDKDDEVMLYGHGDTIPDYIKDIGRIIYRQSNSRSRVVSIIERYDRLLGDRYNG